MTCIVVLLRSMQRSSTDDDIGSGGEAICPVSVATRLTPMTPVIALQVRLLTLWTLNQGLFHVVLSGGLGSHTCPYYVTVVVFVLLSCILLIF